MTTKMKASDYIAAFLHQKGVRSVFELSGGMITHLLDSLCKAGQIRIVSVHHEQAAAFAADATGRITGVPGVAMATSGPGATNLLTGIGSCFFDSSPAVFITGQVNRHELKGDRKIRQLGFQETDIVSMAAPITKAAWQVLDPKDLAETLERAFALAIEGRPGPVLVDIPMDVQRAEIEIESALNDHKTLDPGADRGVPDLVWTQLSEALKCSQRPLILAGGGVRAGSAAELFGPFVEQLGIPAVNSLMAVDLLPYKHPLRVGLIGSYGNRWANLAIAESDLLIVLGSRLDIRQTGSDTAFFKRGRTIFHVDCEAGEINNRVVGCHSIVANVRDFLKLAVKKLNSPAAQQKREWVGRLRALQEQYPDTAELPEGKGINPNQFIHQLSRASTQAAAYVVDVGQHQMWAAQSTEVSASQRWITSGGMGSMGFSLPAAVGTSIAVAPRPIVVVAGDGSFQCNIQELQTIVRNKLAIKIVVINNRCHGMVRQFQQSYFDERYQSTLWGYDTPDFVSVAQAYGITGRRVETEDQIESGLAFLWEDASRPALLEVMIDTYANSYPKIAFGRPLSDMEPQAKPVEMEGT
jgi:acetolactate synthase-1/2/3 large subunit